MNIEELLREIELKRVIAEKERDNVRTKSVELKAHMEEEVKKKEAEYSKIEYAARTAIELAQSYFGLTREQVKTILDTATTISDVVAFGDKMADVY